MDKTISLKKTLALFLFSILLLFIINFINNRIQKITYAQTTYPTLPPNISLTPSTTVNPTTAKGTWDAIVSGQPQPIFDYPNLYPTYYQFAKTRIFNNQEFWILPSDNTASCPPPPPGVKVEVVGPQTVANLGDSINYNVSVTYTGTDSIILTDTLPASTTYVSSSPNGNYNSSSKSISWPLTAGGTKSPYLFSLVLKAAADNVVVTNAVCASVQTYSSPNPSQPVTSPNPSQPAQSPSPSPVMPPGGWCDVNFIKQTWLQAGANPNIDFNQASCVCKVLSNGDPKKIDMTCENSDAGTDFVGLFQNGVEDFCTDTKVFCYATGSCLNNLRCVVGDRTKFNACRANGEDPVTNVKDAFTNHYAHGQWTDWLNNYQNTPVSSTLQNPQSQGGCGVSYPQH